MVEYVDVKDKDKFDPRTKSYTFQEVKNKINFWTKFQTIFIFSILALGTYILDKDLTTFNLLLSLGFILSYYYLEWIIIQLNKTKK